METTTTTTTPHHGDRVQLLERISFLGHHYEVGSVATVETASTSDGTLRLKMSDGRQAFAHDSQVEAAA